MLPQKNRLLKDRDFRRVLKNGKGFKDPFFYIKLKSNRAGYTRIGIVVGRKVSLKSVVRNKIKRRAREILRELLPKAKKGIDIVIISFPKSKELTFKDTKKSITSLFKKVKLLDG